MIIILVLINYFSLSYQTVPTRLFCDNFLREIYLINETTNIQKIIIIEKTERI